MRQAKACRFKSRKNIPHSFREAVTETEATMTLLKMASEDACLYTWT